MAQKKTLALVNQLIDLDPRELILVRRLNSKIYYKNVDSIDTFFFAETQSSWNGHCSKIKYSECKSSNW